jgi:hypothetical protein
LCFIHLCCLPVACLWSHHTSAPPVL